MRNHVSGAALEAYAQVKLLIRVMRTDQNERVRAAAKEAFDALTTYAISEDDQIVFTQR